MITTMNSLSVAILSSICLVGCSPVPKSETLEVRDFKALVEGPQGAASTTFLGLLYCGDHSGFSYFVLRRRLASDRWLKIAASTWPADKRMNFVRDEKQWVESNKAVAALTP